MLIELCNIGYIRVFDGSDGKKYGLVCGFLKHQRVSRSTPSKFKELITNNERSLTTHAQLSEDSPQERKGKERKGREGKGKDNNVKFVFDHWRLTMDHQQAKLDDKRTRIIRKALLAGYDTGQLVVAIDGCKQTPWNMGDNPGGTVYDSIDLILRDAEHIDRFIKHFDNPPSSKNNQRLSNNEAAASAASEAIS